MTPRRRPPERRACDAREVAQRVDAAEDLADLLKRFGTESRQFGPPPAALDQGRAERVLQLADLHG